MQLNRTDNPQAGVDEERIMSEIGPHPPNEFQEPDYPDMFRAPALGYARLLLERTCNIVTVAQGVPTVLSKRAGADLQPSFGPTANDFDDVEQLLSLGSNLLRARVP